jgi:hypothetical protein
VYQTADLLYYIWQSREANNGCLNMSRIYMCVKFLQNHHIMHAVAPKLSLLAPMDLRMSWHEQC